MKVLKYKGENNFLWVVKTSFRIIGPLTTKQVNTHIENKDIVGIDEIIADQSDPFANWYYVRDVSCFQKALSKQIYDSGIEDTKTQTNFYISKTTGEISIDLDENVQDLPVSSHSDRTSQRILSKGFFYTLIFILLGVGGLFGFQKWQDFQESLHLKSKLLEDSQKNYILGNYKQAYIEFKNLEDILEEGSHPNGFYVRLSALVLNQEKSRQTVWARELLGKSEEAIQRTPEWLTTMSLSYLMDQNFLQAQIFLDQSLSEDPNFLPTWMNYGYMYLRQRKFDKAWDAFYSAYLRGHIEGHVLLFMSLSLIEQWKGTQELRTLKKAHGLIQNILSTSADRRHFLQIIDIWLGFKTQIYSKKILNQRLLSFIESDPYTSQEFKISPYEYHFQAQVLKSYCMDIKKEASEDQKLSLLFLISCYHSLGLTGASIDEPMKQVQRLYPQDPLVLATNSIILDQAEEVLKRDKILEQALNLELEKNHTLPFVLKARFCEQKQDYACSAIYWKKVYDLKPLEIGAYSGLAQSFYYQSPANYREASRWVEDGLILSSSYKPLLRLQNALEEMKN